jgi:hypothetical protein
LSWWWKEAAGAIFPYHYYVCVLNVKNCLDDDDAGWSFYPIVLDLTFL